MLYLISGKKGRITGPSLIIPHARRMPDAAAMVDNNNASTLIAGLLKPEVSTL